MLYRILKMFPEEFIKRLGNQTSLNQVTLIESLRSPEPVSIRINDDKWRHNPEGAPQVPWSKNGWYLKSRPSYTLDPLFHSGCYYPQEASSMFLETVFNQLIPERAGIKVLDLCGAPGGKSTHISSLIGEKGFLIANEVIRSRASVLSENLTKWGHGNSIVTQNDPSLFRRLGPFFDVILVDAPCSGEGMFRDEIAVNEWSPDNAAHCSERQKRILMDIWPALKENGLLIYSTCTFNPDENERNVSWFSDMTNSESKKLNISDMKGVIEIEQDNITGYAFYPDQINGNGFFISVIKKTGGSDITHHGHQNISEFSVSGKYHSFVRDWTTFLKGELIRMGDDLFGLPCSTDDFLLIRKNLKIIKAGTRLCTVKNNDFIPSHELALSLKLQKGTFASVELDYQQAISFLRRDNLILPALAKGWYIITYKGVNLGFVKNIGNRFNNYYPVEWRIRMDKIRMVNQNLIKWETDIY